MRFAKQHIFFLLGTAALLFSGCRQEYNNPVLSEDLACLTIQCDVPYDSVDRSDTPCRVTLQMKQYTSLEDSAQIHLRGNSTATCPKRPLLLKLDHSSSVCGLPEAKSWVLLANYFDKTMLRNSLAFKMAENSRLGWTPSAQFVELSYNDDSKGVYQLCEKVQVHPNRLNLPDGGWLIEVDARTTKQESHFRTPLMERPFRVEWPKADELSTERLQQIQAFVQQAEEALFSADFTDPVNGWRKYLDEASWIDWYLLNEIAKNNDAIFFSSCFMHCDAQGKIIMGPIWDFDLGYGNCYYNATYDPRGWYIRKSNWYARLFQDTLFAQKVREKFDDFYNNRANYVQFIRSNAAFMQPYALNNDNIWHTIGVKIEPNLVAYDSYEEEVEALVKWLEQRFEWLKANL